MQVSPTDCGSGSGIHQESLRGTISFVYGYRDWEDLGCEWVFGIGAEDVFGEALVGAVTFFKPCGVGRLSHTLCAVISHTQKRGCFFGMRLDRRREFWERKEVANDLSDDMFFSNRSDITDARIAKPACFGARGRNPGELKELPGLISISTSGSERVEVICFVFTRVTLRLHDRDQVTHLVDMQVLGVGMSFLY